MSLASAPSDTTFIEPHADRKPANRITASNRAACISDLPLSANADIAARGAIVAAVLADHGVVAAFRAGGALHDRRYALRGRFAEHPRLRERQAVLAKDAKHRVAVNDQAREVGHSRRPGLLPLFA